MAWTAFFSSESRRYCSNTDFDHYSSPGVHWLQDPRSRVYNFTPWLQKVPKVNDFAFERLSGFIKSSRDEVHSLVIVHLFLVESLYQELRSMALRENKRFAGSTSSLSGMLCHIYFLLSEHKDIDYSILSQHFKNQVCAWLCS
jgi:hypothetical protein